MKIKSEWTHKRQVSHWILEQLLHNSIESFHGNYIIDDKGKLIVEVNSITHRFDESRSTIKHLINLNKHTATDIYKAITLLYANKHIECTNEEQITPLKQIEIKATSSGSIAFIEDYYLELIEERRSNWEKRNWAIATFYKHIITLLVGTLLGILLGQLLPLKSSPLPSTETHQTEK
jgi:hypothetical protein